MEIPAGYAKCSPFGKINVDLAPKSCKFTVNQLVWRIRISKLNLGLAPKSCKYMQIYCKPAGLQDQDLKAEPGFGTKFMQIHCLPGGLDDQDTKSEISKIKFAS
jgi:hypothetical protein